MTAMVIRMVVAFLLLNSVHSQETHHVCNSTKSERAGGYGMVDVVGTCQLTLTNIEGTISILGAWESVSCSAERAFSINGNGYCANATAHLTGTVMEISGDQIVIKAKGVQRFKIEFYHGKLAWCLNNVPVGWFARDMMEI